MGAATSSGITRIIAVPKYSERKNWNGRDVDNTDAAPDALRHLTEEQTERLSAVLDDYLARLEAVRPPIERLCSVQLRHPLSLELYLGKLGELHNFAAGFSPHLAGTDDLGEPQREPIRSRKSSRPMAAIPCMIPTHWYRW